MAALRREKLGAVASEKFFDPSNRMGTEARAQFRVAVLDSMIGWLQDEGQVAVYDASNATEEQRKFVKDKLESAFRQASADKKSISWCRLIWIECSTDDPITIERNFFEATIKSSDFEGMSKSEALAQFQKKMQHYTTGYCGLEEEQNPDPHTSFIKISDGGKRVVAHNVMGYLESKLVSFLMNVHSEPRTVLLARHGQTDYNVNDRVGGDSDLTNDGREFGKNLARFIHTMENNNWVVPTAEATAAAQVSTSSSSSISSSSDRDRFLLYEKFDDSERRMSSELVVWTSTANRAVQTVESVKSWLNVAWNALAEIDAGVCESMTYTEIRVKMPLEYAERQKDKYYWRYPRGESYADVTRRLEPVIFEIERQRRPVLVVAHRAVLRCLLGYFEGTPKEQVPFVPLPLHSVVVMNADREGWRSQRFRLPPDVPDSGKNEPGVVG